MHFKRAQFCILFFLLLIGFSDTACFAAQPAQEPPPPSAVELKKQAWQALAHEKYEDALQITAQCLTLYKAAARQEQESLTDFPWESQKEIRKYALLNNVGECLLIRGMAFEKLGRIDQAREVYQELVDAFYFSQVTDDPQCNWAWKPAEAAREKLDEMGEELEGLAQKKAQARIQADWDADAQMRTPWNLADTFTGTFFWSMAPAQVSQLKLVIQELEALDPDRLSFKGVHYYNGGEDIINVEGDIHLTAKKMTIREVGPVPPGFTIAGTFEGKFDATLSFLEGLWVPDEQPGDMWGEFRLFANTPKGRQLRVAMQDVKPAYPRPPLETPKVNSTGCGLVETGALTHEQAFKIAEQKAYADIVHHTIMGIFIDQSQPAYQAYYKNRNQILSEALTFLSDINIWGKKTWKHAAEVRLSATCDRIKLKAYLREWGLDPDHPQTLGPSKFPLSDKKPAPGQDILYGTGSACNDYVLNHDE